jgi:hypothetical protein
MPENDTLTATPARIYVLGDGLTVEVDDCTATLWSRGGVVHVLLSRGPGDMVAMEVDLDLLAAGVLGRVDHGRVTVWSCPEQDVVCLGLRATRHAVVELPYGLVVALLAGPTPTRSALDGLVRDEVPARHRHPGPHRPIRPGRFERGG